MSVYLSLKNNFDGLFLFFCFFVFVYMFLHGVLERENLEFVCFILSHKQIFNRIWHFGCVNFAAQCNCLHVF